VEPRYDVFVSYAWVDRDVVQPLAQALRDHGLRVFVDAPEIEDFTRITTTIIQGLAASRVLVAYYSKQYPTRRACQWELTAAYLAAQRIGDPSRRILVLNPESTLDHLYPGELRDALAGRPPMDGDQAALEELAQAVVERVQQLPGPLGEVAPLVPARWLPTQGLGSTRFVGRLAEMWRLHSALHPDTTRLTVGRTGPAVAQLRGLGGIGKTLLAEEYALRFGAAYPGGVFWLRAYGSHEDQRSATFEELAADHDRQVRAIAARLGLPVADRSPDEVLGTLARELEERGQACLWVVDDLPDGLQAPQVQALLAPHPVAHTLLTTRSRRYGDLAEVVDLDVLPHEDALALLTRHRPARSNQEQADAAALVAELGYHALAVDVAGAALRTQIGLASFAEFRAAVQDPSQDELELPGDLAPALPGGHQASIAATLGRSINRLDPPARDVLRLAAVVAAAPVALTLIAAILQDADGLDEQAARRQATRGVGQAQTFSLASPTGLGADPDATSEPTVEDGWVVHALVARTIRLTDPDQPRIRALQATAVAVLTQALQVIVDPSAHSSLRQIIPHARELARHPTTTAEVELLSGVAHYDHARGDYGAAEQALRQVLEAYRRLLGPEHPNTLASMHNLAMTLLALGDAAGAAELHRQVLDTRRRVLEPEHPDMLLSMHNLAEALRVQGDAAGAADLLRPVVDVRRRVLGPEHPNTLVSMDNLAVTLVDLGDAAGAVELQRQVVDAYRRVLGPEHPDTLTAMDNLAVTLHVLGDAAGAADLLRPVLDARRRVLGPEHPATLRSMSNLAAALVDLGDAADAAELHRQVLDVRRRLLGPQHPHTLLSMDNLAMTLVALGHLAGARDLLQQAAYAYHQLLGPEHPTTRAVTEHLIRVQRALAEPAP
jgi:tetratricopeptide (TPR) repeat protein